MEKKHQIIIAKKIDQEIKKTTDSINEYKKLNKPMAPDNAIGRVSSSLQAFYTTYMVS